MEQAIEYLIVPALAKTLPWYSLVCMYMFIYVCVYVCMCMCVCMYMCVWMCTSTCMCTCTCRYTYTYMLIHYVCICLCKVPRLKKQVLTMPKEGVISAHDVLLTRWTIAFAYAVGTNILTPWGMVHTCQQYLCQCKLPYV